MSEEEAARRNMAARSFSLMGREAGEWPMGWFGKSKGKKPIPPSGEKHLPAHIGIIMDGNGRWAKSGDCPARRDTRPAPRFFGGLPNIVKKSGYNI